MHDMSILKRSKRFLTGLVISLLTSIGVGSIFGAVSASQISTLKTGVNELGSKQNLIIHQLKRGSKEIMTNRNMINGLESLTIKLAKFTTTQHFEANGMLLYVLMSAEYARIDDALDQYTQIVEASTNHRFHPSILSQHGGIAAFEEIKAIAEIKGLTPIINNAQQMSQLQTHFYFTPTGLTLVIEIPLGSEHNTFTLHKFDALPLQLGTEVYVKIVPDYPLIGIGEPDINGKAKYIEMNLMDLARCQKLGKTYLCTEQRIVHRPDAQSCLYALFVSDHRAAQHSCRINLEGKNYDQVVAVSSDKFAYYSTHPSTFQYVCKNRTTIQGQQLMGISEIQVPESCRVETSSFILHRQSDLYREAHPKQFRWTLPALSFLQNDTSITDINSAVKALENTKGTPPIDPEFINEFKRLNQPFYMDKFPITTFTVAALALLLILCMIITVVYKNYKASKVTHNLKDPTYRFKQLLKEDSNVEFLEQLISRRSST